MGKAEIDSFRCHDRWSSGWLYALFCHIGSRFEMSDKPPSENPLRSHTVPSAAIVIALSQDDFETLLLSLGMAAGVCLRDGIKGLALRIIELSNTVNENNPHWIPYDTADERTSPPNLADQPDSST